MKKIMLLTLILGAYALPASASDVDSDYSNLSTPHYDVMSNEDSITLDRSLETVDAGEVKTDAQLSANETPWVGTTYQVGSEEPTHRFPFDDYGYDEE